MCSTNIRTDKIADHQRVFAKRARVDDGIVRIGVHVRYRKEIPMDSNRARLFAGDAAEVFCILQATGRTDGHCIREGCGAVQPIADSQLEIGSDEQRQF